MWMGLAVLFFLTTIFTSLLIYYSLRRITQYEELILQKVDLTGTILKPNMILPGSSSNKKISSEEIAELTIKCLIESVPQEVPGIAFLSGGQTEIEATKNLDAINKKNKSNFIMTYSYGRALQQSALKHWSKNTERRLDAQL